MKRFAFLVIIIILFTEINYSQKILTLNESINIALKKSYSIKSSKQNLESSIKSLESAKMNLLSKVDLDFDAPSYNRNLSPQFNTITGLTQFFEVGETRFQGNLSISQPLIFSNGTISLIGSLFGREQYSEISADQTTKDYYSNFAIQLRQPLFTLNTQKQSLERAEANLEKTQTSFTKSQFDLIFEVTQSFYNLFQATKQFEISKIDEEQRDTAYSTAVRKFNAGLVPEVEMLQLEVELASGRNELMQKRRGLAQAQNSFKVLIGLTLEENIDVIPELDYNPITIDSTQAVSLALKNSLEIKNIIIDKQLQQFSVDEVNARRGIRADIIANFGLNKNDKSANNLIRDFSETKSVVLNLTVPIWDWGSNRLAVEAAEANLISTELNLAHREILIKQDIIDLLYRIDLAKSRIDVVKRGLEVAQKSYEISLNRFNTGQIKSDAMVIEQKRFTNAKIENLNAIIDYKIAIADLKRSTLFDFETNTPLKLINSEE